MTISTFSSSRNIQLGDKVLINRGGLSYYADITELKDNAEDDDLLLINFQGSSYKCRYADIDSNGADSAIMLINRDGKSYYTTLGEIRGVLGFKVTFDVKLTSPSSAVSKSEQNKCGPQNKVLTPGAVITARFTASTSLPYSFEAFNPGNGSLFKIANEWMLCAGGTGNGIIAVQTYGNYCVNISTTTSPALGFAAAGVKDLSPGSGPKNWSSGSTAYNTLGSGAGCPGSLNYGTGVKPGLAGYSQYRTNAEESGDSFNDVKFETTPQFSANSVDFEVLYNDTPKTGPLYYEITYNGITKFYKLEDSVLTGDLPLTGIIGDLLTWT